MTFDPTAPQPMNSAQMQPSAVYVTPPPVYIAAVAPKAPSNGNAIAALVCGIVAVVTGIWAIIPILGIGAAFFGFGPTLAAVICGHLGRSRARKIGGNLDGMALTGLVLGYITLGAIVLGTVFGILALAASAASNAS